jgi:glutamate N-acetyltransferase/amino-acid N-acetyltransferase
VSEIEPIAGGVTAPAGFGAAAARVGLRIGEGPDLTLVASTSGPVPAAATFTTNRFKAAPVVLSQRALGATRGQAAAIVLNAGCANAGTGPDGMTDAMTVRAAVASRLGVRSSEVLVASTGLIGSRLEVPKILAALPGLKPRGSRSAGREAATAIMTTDTRPKEAAVRIGLDGGGSVTVGGMAKGAGMIHPQMATMLAVLTTDARVEPGALRSLLRRSVERSFNQVTVDGDPSTNDCVFLLASGVADVPPVTEGSPEMDRFARGLDAACTSLARQIASDGEGATRRIDVTVSGAWTDADARLVARAVAGSNLVKAAVHGSDPNWGRIAAAAGRSGARLDPDRLTVTIGQQEVYRCGPVDFDERAASRALSGREVAIGLDLGIGPGWGEAWGCDLSAEYVAINSEYRT